ncbi:MAG: hypothetical protein ACRC6R_10200 [Bacteroidales bacterium]
MNDLINEYKRRKSQALFSTAKEEMECIEPIMDKVIDIMISFDNTMTSPEYINAQSVWRYFNPIYVGLEAKYEHEEKLRKLRDRVSQHRKKYWDKNKDSINESRKRK